MKRYLKFVILCLLASLLLVQTSFAGAEKKAGFVKNSWRRLLRNFRRSTRGRKMAPVSRPSGKAADLKSAKASPQALSPITLLSGDEIRARIKSMLEMEPDIVNYIPGLRITTDPQGNVVKVKYTLKGVALDLANIKKPELIKLHNKVNSERIRIYTERIQRQLKSARRATHLLPALPPRPVVPPTTPKLPPKVPNTSLPSTPRAPNTSVSTPKAPPLPPPKPVRR